MPKINISQNLTWPLVVLVIAISAFWLKPWQANPQEVISTQASGKTQVTPNIAKISATIESKNPNLDQARAENEQKVSNLVTKLKELGVEDKNIKTEYISGGPGYEILTYPPTRPNTNQLTTTLEITVINFDIADEVIAVVTNSGATNLYGPNLTVSDEKLEDAKSAARKNAVESARKKAEELAKLSNRKLGKVVKIQEQGDFDYPVPLLAQSEADLRQKASSLQPGQNEVTINLLVDFSLK